MRHPFEHRPANHIQLPVLHRPVTASLLQLFPVASVQVMVLRTDIGHVETLLHGLLVPFVVRRRTDVPAVIARMLIVVRGHGIGHFRVGQELVRPARHLLETFRCQSPRHPVGLFRLRIVVHDISLVPDQLRTLLPQQLRQAHFRIGCAGCGGTSPHLSFHGHRKELPARPSLHISFHTVVASG